MPVVPVDQETEAVLVSITMDYSLVDRIAGLALKPLASPELTIDGRPFRIVDATAGTPGLLYVPGSSGWSDAMRVNTRPPKVIAVSRPATITFFRMDVERR